jgi:hypothetical protein
MGRGEHHGPDGEKIHTPDFGDRISRRSGPELHREQTNGRRNGRDRSLHKPINDALLHFMKMEEWTQWLNRYSSNSGEAGTPWDRPTRPIVVIGSQIGNCEVIVI